ncbi:hypothetical protein RvY_09760 [Ramazzottius varieornatus]|uniref:Uncharacterized protein n=1 Tax=Ramazzottius varieornatus TaxID=947166 RepID=A0A1D1VAG6_RAMVA|nr:hypothetical protein RvY_09760 [Ramazzottius varieornatus]
MDEGVMDCRALERPSRIFKKSCCRNLFGADRNDPKIRTWLEKQLSEIKAKNNQRMRDAYGIDVERNEVVESKTEKVPFQVMEIQTIPGHYKAETRPDGSAACLFAEFPSSTTKRSLPHISAISPRKKFSLKPSLSSIKMTLTSTSTVRKNSTQQTLLGSLTVRKTPCKTQTKASSTGASPSPCALSNRTGTQQQTREEPSPVSAVING